jgi:undecaprenyl diphosphate synthase
MAKLIDWIGLAFEEGVRSVSLYMLSKANLRRSDAELDIVTAAEVAFVLEAAARARSQWKCAIRVAGKSVPLPNQLDAVARTACESLPDSERTLYLCIAYEPFEELAAAVERLPTGAAPDDVLRALWVPERIDLVIRSGGGLTLSEFLPLQCSYARLLFMEKLFNDIDTQEFLDLLASHRQVVSFHGT